MPQYLNSLLEKKYLKMSQPF